VQWLGADRRSTSQSAHTSACQNKIQVTASEAAVSHLNRMERVHICYCNLRTKAFCPSFEGMFFNPEALPIPAYNIEMPRV